MVRKGIQLLIVLCFVGLLGAYGVLTIIEPSTDISGERRNLSEFPDTPSDKDSLLSWPKQFESWLNDHLFSRTLLIRHFNLARYKAGISPQNAVVIGKNKWTYSTNEGIIEDYRNVDLLTEDELDHWLNYLEYRYKQARDNNYYYMFLITPNKATIHDENLPDHITRVNKQSRFDQILEAAKSRGIELLDIRPELIEAKKDGPVYISRDSHWNYRGAEIAFIQVVELLAEDFSGIEWQPLETSEYEYLGAYKIGRNGLRYYAGNVDTLNWNHHPDFKDYQPIHPRIFPENLNHKMGLIEHEHYKTFPLKTRQRTFKKSLNPNKPWRLLVIRDSFVTAMEKYISETFGYAAYVWVYPRMGHFDKAIETTKPDIVIEQRVERKLAKVPRPGIEYPESMLSN